MLWAAHSYNVAYSDEIGHFEYCNAPISRQGGHCTVQDPGEVTSSSAPFGDDTRLLHAPGVRFPGQPGQPNVQRVPGRRRGQRLRRARVPERQLAREHAERTRARSRRRSCSRARSSAREGKARPIATTRRWRSRPTFRASRERTPRRTTTASAHLSNPADPSPGSGCVDPPNGASFYPIYTTTTGPKNSCWWQEGGGSIPGTHEQLRGCLGRRVRRPSGLQLSSRRPQRQPTDEQLPQHPEQQSVPGAGGTPSPPPPHH